VFINISEGEACLQAGDWGFEISMELQQGQRRKEKKRINEKKKNKRKEKNKRSKIVLLMATNFLSP
jgi:hypothetical protein